MRIDVFSIFGELIEGVATHALLGKAQARGILDLRVHDIREHATDVHRSTDDAPFGGGAGMVMTPGPIFNAVEAVEPPRPLLLLSPSGETFNQAMAERLAESEGFSLLCGRYEGVDQRVVDHLCDGEVSVGDVVLNGGEIAALVIIEAVARLLPGMMGNAESAVEESFHDSLLEYPHYTRPAAFRDWEVPAVLRSGDHAKVARWRLAQRLQRTLDRRPDLIEARGGLTPEETAVLAEFAE
jgi:tRNA (guanine37-N1)-methyltransferase